MIIKYDNNTLFKKAMPEINTAIKKIPTYNNYNIKNKCPKDYQYIGMLNQILSELEADVSKLSTLKSNIQTKNQRITNIHKHVNELIYYNRIDMLKVQKRKI